MNTYPRRYVVKDANNNEITVTAWSKKRAKQQYRQTFGDPTVRIVSVTEVGLASSPPRILGDRK